MPGRPREWASARREELRRRFETALVAAGRLHAAAGNYQAAVTALLRERVSVPPAPDTTALAQRLAGRG